MRASRRGRKRSPGRRHPGGKLRQRPRSERVEDVVAVAREARERVHGVSKADAARPEAGDMIGRLVLSGELTPAQHAAASAYADMRRAYDQAMGARRTRSASDILGSGTARGSRGADTGAHEAWAKRRIAAYERTRQALASCHDPLAMMVLDAVVLEGRTLWRYLGTLRLALNAVGRVLVQ